MRFERKIYDLNWFKLATILMPYALRKPVLLALVKSFISDIAAVHNEFWRFKNIVENELTYTGQVVYLEKFLNENYDYVLRRIRIVDPNFFNTAELYLKVEANELVTPIPSDNINAPVLYTKSESAAQGDDFIIKIHSAVVVDENKIKAQLKKLILPTKNYSIVYE